MNVFMYKLFNLKMSQVSFVQSFHCRSEGMLLKSRIGMNYCSISNWGCYIADTIPLVVVPYLSLSLSKYKRLLD